MSRRVPDSKFHLTANKSKQPPIYRFCILTGYLATHPGRSGMAAAQDLLDSYKDVTEDNDILKRARHMMSMAASMQNFTRGEGKIKTTQDFFTAAEFFAEESNRLYKLIRMFSYIVPMGEDKRALMQIADHIPRHCGQMQLLIQMPGVSCFITLQPRRNVSLSLSPTLVA